MYSLDDTEIRAFLLEGTRTGKLGYRAADGRPLVAPVWFVIEGGRLVFNTGKDTAKGRALARDPRVAVCVDLEQPPFAYVQVQGVAEFSEDPADLVTTATSTRWGGTGLLQLALDDADQAIAVHAVTAVWYCNTRCCALLNRTITNANSTTAAREALTAAGFAVLDMTVPGLELFAQPFWRPSSWPGPSGG